MAPAKRINLLFGGLVALLGGFALVYSSFYLDRGPVIRSPATASLPPGHPSLPENHPPLDYARELAALEERSHAEPQNPDYRTRIGNIYYDIGQYEKAVEAFQQSLALRPQSPSVETDLATCYHILGQHDRALEILDKVLRYRPNFPQALFNKGIVLHSGKKDLKGAIAAWEELLRTNPNLPQRADLEQRIEQLKASQR
jgi:tetratricopeptide (TPR) repeat protein